MILPVFEKFTIIQFENLIMLTQLHVALLNFVFKWTSEGVI